MNTSKQKILKNKTEPSSPNQNSPGRAIWHTKAIADISAILKTNLNNGISSKEAQERIKKSGLNELEEKKGRTPFKIFISQFNDFMIWILIAAAFISGILIREISDAIVIVVILVINSTLGFIQEYRAEKALQALKELASPTAIVIRDGKEENINSKYLVPGDLIKLVSGDLVPADCRVISEVNLQADESIITGESMSVDKITTPFKKTNLTLGDRKNMLFSGTTIVKGRCSAIVIETGGNTEIGKIANLVQQKEELTPLQIELKTVGKKIGIICIIVSAIVFASGILKGNELGEMLLVAVALAVAAIPEGLPAIVTVSLALGVQKMAKNNAIVRKLSSVETLGSVSVICTDKTGTLTENKMMVKKIFSGLEEEIEYKKLFKNRKLRKKKDTPVTGNFESSIALKLLIENALLCNDAYYSDEESTKITGEPTEIALLEMGSTYCVDKKNLELKLPRKLEEPFDSDRKMMTTIHEISPDNYYLVTPENSLNNKSIPSYILFSKGAPEIIVKKSKMIIKNNRIENLTFKDKEKIININKSLANGAMRNLAFGFKYLDSLPDEKTLKDIENNLTYCGMVGMIDPPRPEVYDAIKRCRKANIKVIMVTGDHKLTAKAIGEELDILDTGDKIIDGEEFAALTKEELEEQIENIKIFARVSPSNKVDIINALKKNNHIVAMTGDGINDAPSLKKADIGLAMGISGTDVSKESSDMILTDDNFATIVKAIKEGRVIYDNLKKFILFLLSCNISEVLLMFISIVIGDYIFYLITGETGLLYIPLLPVQILWMNLITDGLPAMALGIDPPEKNIMDRKVTKKREQILSKRRLITVLWQGLILTLGSLFIYFTGPLFFNTHNFFNSREIFQTSVFTTLVISQLLHTYNFRFEERGIFRKGIFGNKYLNLAIIVSFLLQITIIYTPFLQTIFKTTSLGIYHWLLIIGSSIVSVLLINLINEIIYKRKRRKSDNI
ncbi:MAG: cation-translocating P-type ATPase [Actinobacteria bacterium]|nr:cation-translocating P-type ATPase [Actinomycetota bacterium]